MAGPRTGRMIGAVVVAMAVLVVVRSVPEVAASDHGRLVLVPSMAAAAYSVVRLLSWTLLWRHGRIDPPDRRARAEAEVALGATEVAVVCDGESMVLVRTAAIAAIAATGSPTRVLLVGADPRLDQVARRLGVRRVDAGRGQRAGIAAAVAAATGAHLVLTSASSAVLPGALLPALERFDRGAVWVQWSSIGPGDRSVIDHVRHDRWWPSLDARGAMPWLGYGSIVLVEAFRTLPLGRGAGIATVAAQSQGWHGRWHRSMVAVEQVEAGTIGDREVSRRADRFRLWRSRFSPLWTRRLRPWQRIAHVAVLVEDLAGSAAAVAVSAVSLALFAGTAPVPVGSGAAEVAVVIGLAWVARLLLTGGLVRPGAMCRAATDDIGPSIRAVVSSLRPTVGRAERVVRPTPIRGWRSIVGLIVAITVVDVAIGWRAWHVIVADDAMRSVAGEAIVFGAGVATVASLLASARVLRRNRTLRGSRRLPVDVAARIGTHQGRVLDLAAGGLRAEFAAPADLLAELPVRLVARGLDPVDVRVQVVRVEPRADTWVLGLRLAGGGLAGEHDDYLALWLWQMAGAAEERPRREPDPVVGRLPFRAGGVPAVRLATALAMVAVGIAVIPPAGAGLAAGSELSVVSTLDVPASSAGTNATTSTDATATAGTDSSGDGTGDEIGPGEPSGSADAPSVVSTLPYERPTTSSADLTLTTSVDDDDRQVEGGQVVTHTATLHNASPVAVSTITVVVVPDVGLIDVTTLAGTCPGSGAGIVAFDGPGTVGWHLLGTAGALEPDSECTVTWRESLPAATELEDGSSVVSAVNVTEYAMAGRVGSSVGPSVRDELVVRRPTLRLSAEAGDGSSVAEMSIGQPFTWVLEVSNISPNPVTAHGIDLVHSLPKHWVYTATMSVSPMSCDVAPVVLVDDAAGTQTVTWSDMCDLAQGDDLVLVFSATPQDAAIDDPGVVDASGAAIAHTSEVVLTAEDAAGNTLGSAGDTAAAVARTVDLVARLTDTGPDDGTATTDPAVVVGGLGRYRVDVANEGADATVGPVAVTVDLPDGVTMVEATGEGWTCTAGSAGSTVDCSTAAVIAPGEVAPPMVVTVAIGASALVDDGSDGDPEVAVASATVTVSGGGLDRDTSNDVDGETTLVRRDADVELSGALSSTTPSSPGARVDWILTPTVVGPAAVSGELVLEDTMPLGLRFVSARGRGWNCSGSQAGTGFSVEPDANGTLSCRRQVTDAAAGAALDALVVTVQIDPAFVGDAPIPGRVVIAGDRNPVNDAADRRTAPSPQAELSVVTVTGGRRVTVGDDVTYEVVVTNQGPAAEVRQIEASAAVPVGLAVQAVAGAGWECTIEEPSDVSGGSWRCTWDAAATPVTAGMLLPSIGVTATVAPGAVPNLAPSAREPFSHDVVVSGGSSGATTPTSRLSWTADPAATNSIAIVDDAPDAWQNGVPRTLRVVVGTDGPSGEYGPVIVQIPVSSTMDVADADGDGWNCGVTRRAGDDPEVVRTIECAHARRGVDYGAPLVEPGETLAPIELTVVPAADGEQTQQVVVVGVTDADPHRATASMEVARSAGLSLVVDGPAEARAGDEIELTWTVANAGPSPSSMPLTVTGSMPSGVALVSATGSGWSCESVADTVVCDRDEALGADATSTVVLTLSLGSEVGGGNTLFSATVVGDPSDGTTDDDGDVTNVRVRRTSGSGADGAGAGDEIDPTAAPDPDDGSTGLPRPTTVADLLGYGGSVGAFAMAIVLIGGRRRRGW